MYGLTSCYIEETKSAIPLPYEEFNINPVTILEDISQEQKDIFIPIENSTPIINYAPVNWLQEDYLTIANSIHEFAWNENISNWKLNSILFYLQCDEIAYGSQSVYLTYFKLIKNDAEEYRLVHNIVIQSQENRIGVWAEKYSHLTSTWEEYKLSEFKINSDEALQIAENNNGKLFRENINNNCSVSISINRKSHNEKDWIVTYYGKDSDLEFIINTNTGEYKNK